eukprot:6082337-Pyramimonas_sp.AAC.1
MLSKHLPRQVDDIAPAGCSWRTQADKLARALLGHAAGYQSCRGAAEVLAWFLQDTSKMLRRGLRDNAKPRLCEHCSTSEAESTCSPTVGSHR